MHPKLRRASTPERFHPAAHGPFGTHTRSRVVGRLPLLRSHRLWRVMLRMRIRCRRGRGERQGERQVPGRYRNRLREDGEEDDGVPIPTALLPPAPSASLGPEPTAPASCAGFVSHSLPKPALPARGWGQGTRDGADFAAPRRVIQPLQALGLHLCSKGKPPFPARSL